MKLKVKTTVNTNRKVYLWLAACAYLLWTASASAFYNPQVGRWLNRDPIEEKGGTHLYAFGANRPTLGSDSLGLEFQFPWADVRSKDCTTHTLKTWNMGMRESIIPNFLSASIFINGSGGYASCSRCCKSGALAGQRVQDWALRVNIGVEATITAGTLIWETEFARFWVGIRGSIYGRVASDLTAFSDKCSGKANLGKFCISGTYGGRLEAGGEVAIDGPPFHLTVGFTGYVFAEGTLRFCLQCSDDACTPSVELCGRYGWGLRVNAYFFSYSYESTTEKCGSIWQGAPFRVP